MPPTPSETKTPAGLQPLVVAQEIETSVKEFLQTSFKPSTPGFENLMADFTRDSRNLFRGPYISLNLPFRQERDAGEFFPEVPLGHRPFTHQRQAFERLQASALRSTLVATGTGSGKTECYFLPILDWCLRHAGEPGIKAIIIYPMNALAQDQASRMARYVRRNPHLRERQIRVGLYVGPEPRDAKARMGPEHAITSRQAMHERPPDILLTNYRMLDSLLIRPDRKALWARNAPAALRFLVVDELHTFDGAQGTDLACLIRRLKDRLNVPQRHLCCIGTSATLGPQSDEEAILRYAGDLFDEEFENDALITEQRLDAEEFLDAPEAENRYPSQDECRDLRAQGFYWSPEERIAKLFRSWFQAEPPADVADAAWRAELGHRLKGHAFLKRLLELLDGRVQSLDCVVRQLQGTLPREYARRDMASLVDGFIALLAHALDPRAQPFLYVRIHHWIREMRRMVVSVPADYWSGQDKRTELQAPRPPALLHSDDLPPESQEAALPVVHCRECGGMAWITVVNAAGDGFVSSLPDIYNAYFSLQDDPRLTYLLPSCPASGVLSRAQQVEGYACQKCLHWRVHAPGAQSGPEDPCPACGGHAWKRIWRSTPKTRSFSFMRGSRSGKSVCCAYCGSATGTGIFGITATSMASFVVSRLFASRENREPKLLAFADSVQDAAHKAGFIEARSFRTILRQALASWLANQTERVTYADLHARLSGDLRQQFAPLSAASEEDVSEFIGTMTHADLMWFDTVEALFEADEQPDAWAVAAVSARLEWEAFSELTFRSQFGRTLENTGCLTLHCDASVLAVVARELVERAPERLGNLFARATEPQFLRFLLSVIYRMLRDGAVRIDPDGLDPIGKWAISSGRSWVSVTRSHPLLQYSYPSYGSQARKPLLPSLGYGHHLSSLLDAGQSARWYPLWARKAFPGGDSLKGDILEGFYVEAFDGLTRHGLTEALQRERTPRTWVLKADQVFVNPEVAGLECNRCQRVTHVSLDTMALWQGMPCLNPSCADGVLQGRQRSVPAPLLKEHLTRGSLRRVNARDHSSMLEEERRRRIEERFQQGGSPWYPNLISTTPTLELGVDIGDLASIMLYNVPPQAANYVQRFGRAGRRNGQALGVTLVQSESHDLFFWQDPLAMIAGSLEPPGLYLEAFAILRRQCCAFTLERFCAETTRTAGYGNVQEAVKAMERQDQGAFPLAWLDFVARQADALLDAFQALFRLSDGIQARLKAYLSDDEDDASLARTVLACVQEEQEDGKQWGARADGLTREISQLRHAYPPPTDQEDQIRALDRQRRTYRAIVRKASRKDVLNLLTDKGILPNYAFPEEGVKLQSVIYHPVSEDRAKPEDQTSEYVRPARSALTEFAPGAHFYAEGHRIKVDAVDLKVSELEEWRFCPDCAHMQLEAGQPDAHCPVCHSAKWPDVGQRRRMAFLKQVHALTPASSARITDDQEDRSVATHERQLFAAPHAAADQTQAGYVIDSLAQPFGFQFLPRVLFRDVNFGSARGSQESGMTVKLEGKEIRAIGFELCRECGRELPDGETESLKKTHAPSCSGRRADDQSPYRVTTFLYREFPSEAVRVRLPLDNQDEDQAQMHSFRAALHLGLRRHFRGQVDHLASTTSLYLRERYSAQELYVYDTVPGGTGYLEQLAHPDHFKAVLEGALQELEHCAYCNQEQDPEQERDGCYQCLRRYGDRRGFKQVSRATAMSLLQAMLGHWSDLKAEHLDRIPEAQLEESELEKRFVAWLERNVQAAGGSFAKAPVRGRVGGYRFRIGGCAWEMENQALLDARLSVAQPSRADFLIHPSDSLSTRPIAVFMDGWRFHRDRLPEDFQQRAAIRDSGQLRCWSLAWEDLEDPASSRTRTDAWDPWTFKPLSLKGVPPSADSELRRLLHEGGRGNSAALLLHYLQRPDDATWAQEVGWLAARTLGEGRVTGEDLLARLPSHPSVQEIFREFRIGSFFGLAQTGRSCLAIGAEEADLRAKRVANVRAVLFLDQDADEEAAHGSWRGALRLMNMLQFLPLAYWLCSADEDPAPYPSRDALPLAADGWEGVAAISDASFDVLLRELRSSPAAAKPEVGYEVTQQGKVAGELEWAWPDLRLGLTIEALSPLVQAQLQEEGWIIWTRREAEANMETVKSVLLRRSEP